MPCHSASACSHRLRETLESLTDIRSDTSHNDLLLARRADCLTELRVVPGVDLTLSLDERRIGVLIEDSLGERTIGTLLCRSREDDGNVEEFTYSCVGEHVVVVQCRVEVAGKGVQSDLQIQHE